MSELGGSGWIRSSAGGPGDRFDPLTGEERPVTIVWGLSRIGVQRVRVVSDGREREIGVHENTFITVYDGVQLTDGVSLVAESDPGSRVEQRHPPVTENLRRLMQTKSGAEVRKLFPSH